MSTGTDPQFTRRVTTEILADRTRKLAEAPTNVHKPLVYRIDLSNTSQTTNLDSEFLEMTAPISTLEAATRITGYSIQFSHVAISAVHLTKQSVRDGLPVVMAKIFEDVLSQGFDHTFLIFFPPEKEA